MKPPAHIIVSAGTAFIVGQTLQSVEAGVSCFFSGVLIDVDHVFDYLRRYKKRKLSIIDFFRPDEWGPHGRLFLILHAWEYLPLILLTSFIPGFGNVAWGVFWGVFVHLLLDHLHNKGHPLTYFLFYRWKFSFNYHCFFSQRLKDQEDLLMPDKSPLEQCKKSSS